MGNLLRFVFLVSAKSNSVLTVVIWCGLHFCTIHQTFGCSIAAAPVCLTSGTSVYWRTWAGFFSRRIGLQVPTFISWSTCYFHICSSPPSRDVDFGQRQAFTVLFCLFFFHYEPIATALVKFGHNCLYAQSCNYLSPSFDFARFPSVTLHRFIR